MASRKRQPDPTQVGLTFGGPSLPTHVEVSPDTKPSVQDPMIDESADLGLGSSASMGSSRDDNLGRGETEALDLESFDDYDDSATVDQVPKLRLVDPPKIVRIIVEAVGNRFEVSRLRDNGTTVACVMYTREELVELISRAQSALKM